MEHATKLQGWSLLLCVFTLTNVSVIVLALATQVAGQLAVRETFLCTGSRSFPVLVLVAIDVLKARTNVHVFTGCAVAVALAGVLAPLVLFVRRGVDAVTD